MSLHETFPSFPPRPRPHFSASFLRILALPLFPILLFLFSGGSEATLPLSFFPGTSAADRTLGELSPLALPSSRALLPSSSSRMNAVEGAAPATEGLAASFIVEGVPAPDYPDLFCLHADSGSGPVLECHHDDSPISSPSTSPPFLANDFPSLEQRIPPKAVPDSPSSENSPADLVSPTPPPRSPFV